MVTKLLIASAGLVILLATVLRAVTPVTRNAPSEESFTIRPIGKVHKRGSVTTIEIDKRYQDGLAGLDGFSHVWVFWWFDRNDTPAKRRILKVHPRADHRNPLTGVFATRAPVRPNLIALSLCEVRSIEGNRIQVAEIDAFDETPVIDLKPYLPGLDHTEKVRLPEWVLKNRRG